MDKLKVLSLFSGIGAFEKALTNKSISHEIVAFSEIRESAINVYCDIHGIDNSKNLGDIKSISNEDIKMLGDIDVLFHGSPCQDFSMAGDGAGGEKGAKTRSSLLWETVRISEKLKPKTIIWENVTGVLRGKHKKVFVKYLKSLEEIGYTNSYEVINATEAGVPQNRERVFVISRLGDEFFNFPTTSFNIKPLEEYVEPIKEKIDKNIQQSCQGIFRKEYNNILASKKDIYQCKADSGWQDKKVGVRVSPTIRANKNHTTVLVGGSLKRLTAKDQCLLMGFDLTDYEKIKNHNLSNSEMALLFGNSIVVDVLEVLVSELYREKENG